MKSCSDIKGELGSAPAHGTGHWPGSRGTPGRFLIPGAALGFCLPVSMDTRGIFGYTLPCVTLQPQQRGWGWPDLWFHPNPFSGTVLPLQGGAEGDLLPPNRLPPLPGWHQRLYLVFPNFTGSLTASIL